MRILAAIAALGLIGAAPAAPEVQAGPKGYLIAQINVTDPAAYRDYVPKVNAVIAKFGGRYLVRGGSGTALEGPEPAGRAVVIEFASVEVAKAFYHSPEYQESAPLRRAASTGTSFVVEGVAPTP